MEVEIKIEVRFQQGMGRSITTKNFRVLALKINQLWPFKFLTSEIEVKMEAEVKIEVRFKQRMGISITTKNQGPSFKNDLTSEVEVKMEAEVRF